MLILRPLCAQLTRDAIRDTLRRHTQCCQPTSSVTTARTLDVPDQAGASSAGTDPSYDRVLQAPSVASAPSINHEERDLPGIAPIDGFQPSVVNNEHLSSFGWEWDESLNLNPSFDFTEINSYFLDDVAMNASERPPPISPWPTTQVFESQLQESHRVSGPNSERDNDEFRISLANSLRLHVPDTPLPPTALLNRYIQNFTTKIWPIIPIIHLPTFDPSKTHPLLLLSICSLGALAEGSESARRNSECLFEGVRHAVLQSATATAVEGHMVLEILQAAAIGQTYALLSGDPVHLLTARAFHGSLCVAVLALHNDVAASRARTSASVEPQLPWNVWVRTETVNRLVNAVHIHNGEIVVTTEDPNLRSDPWQIPIAVNEAAFLAKDALQWASMLTRTVSSPAFATYAVLASISAEIVHCKLGPFTTFSNATVEKVQQALLAYLEKDTILNVDKPSGCPMALMLWHSCFLLLFSEVGNTEKVLVCNGKTTPGCTVEKLRPWASVETAKRCVVHALLIVQLLGCLRISDVPGMHVARVAWHAALNLAVYAHYRNSDRMQYGDVDLLTYPEVAKVRSMGILNESDWIAVRRNVCPRRCRVSAYSAYTTLRSFGPWGDAKYYATSLEPILDSIDASSQVTRFNIEI